MCSAFRFAGGCSCRHPPSGMEPGFRRSVENRSVHDFQAKRNSVPVGDLGLTVKTEMQGLTAFRGPTSAPDPIGSKIFTSTSVEKGNLAASLPVTTCRHQTPIAWSPPPSCSLQSRSAGRRARNSSHSAVPERKSKGGEPMNSATCLVRGLLWISSGVPNLRILASRRMAKRSASVSAALSTRFSISTLGMPALQRPKLRLPLMPDHSSSWSSTLVSAAAISPAGTATTPSPHISMRNVNIFPPTVIGYASPYPTVVNVAAAHQRL